MSPQEILSEAAKSKKYGIECSYVSQNDGTGVKVYSNKYRRDLCFERQKLAAANFIGPEAISIINIPHSIGHGYGYITEEVLDLHSQYPEIRSSELRKKYQSQWQELINQMEKTFGYVGVWDFDLNTENVGLKNGELVCLDFGFGTD